MSNNSAKIDRRKAVPTESKAMNEAERLVVFRLDERRFGLPLSNVERVVHVVEVTPVPQTPPIVLGIVNFQGRIIPVFQLRERFGLPPREVQITDQLLIVQTETRMVALLADEVVGVEEAGAAAAADVPGPEFVAGVVQYHESLILICDMERLLTGEEQQAIEAAMTAAGAGA